MKNNQAIPSTAAALFETLFLFAIAAILSLMFTACHAQNGPDRKPDAATHTAPPLPSDSSIPFATPWPGQAAGKNTGNPPFNSIMDKSPQIPEPFPPSAHSSRPPSAYPYCPMPASLHLSPEEIESKINQIKVAINAMAVKNTRFSSCVRNSVMTDIIAAVPIKASDTIVDIGAGTGYFEMAFLERRIPFHKLYAVDTDKNALGLLQYALDKLTYPNREKVIVTHSTRSNILLAPQTIDVALIIRTPFYLELVEGEGFQCLKSLYDAMNTEGRVHVFDSKKGDHPHLKANQKEFETIKLFRKAGFTYVETKKELENSGFLYMIFTKNERSD